MMKTMKQITAAFLAIVMALSLAACGGAETTVVLRGDISDEMGLPTTDTWTLTAKGDIVQTLKEVIEVDLSEYDDETKDYFIELVGSILLDAAQGIEGVVSNDRKEGNTYIIELTVDCTGDAVKKAAEAGILEVDGNANAISLKETRSSLEAQGYKVVE